MKTPYSGFLNVPGGRRGSLTLLGMVWDAVRQRREAGQQHVPLVLLGLLEFGVRAVESVQHAKNPVALVEPERSSCYFRNQTGGAKGAVGGA